MPTIVAYVEFEVFCDKCGAGLCRATTCQGDKIYVEPCWNCIERERDDAYEVGFRAGAKTVA